MQALLTDEECKIIINRLAKKLCARPELIVTRLLSEQDKENMRQGNVPIESLECHIKAWINNGMPDYAHGKDETYEQFKRRVQREEKMKELIEKGHHNKIKYRMPFKDN